MVGAAYRMLHSKSQNLGADVCCACADSTLASLTAGRSHDQVNLLDLIDRPRDLGNHPALPELHSDPRAWIPQALTQPRDGVTPFSMKTCRHLPHATSLRIAECLLQTPACSAVLLPVLTTGHGTQRTHVMVSREAYKTIEAVRFFSEQTEGIRRSVMAVEAHWNAMPPAYRTTGVRACVDALSCNEAKDHPVRRGFLLGFQNQDDAMPEEIMTKFMDQCSKLLTQRQQREDAKGVPPIALPYRPYAGTKEGGVTVCAP